MPPFSNGQANPGTLAWLEQYYPQRDTIRLTVQRPSARRMWTVDLTPQFLPLSSPVSVTVLAGDIAYVTLSSFAPMPACRS